MTKTYFEDWMKETGRHVDDDMAFGALEGFPYNIQLAAAGQPPVFTVRFWLGNDAAKALKELRQHALADNIVWAAPCGALQATVTPQDDFYAKALLHSTLSSAQKAFTAIDIKPPENCSFCGNANCDVYASVEDAYRPVHKACLETNLNLPEEDTVPQTKVKGHYATGFVGAFVGALVGAVPVWAWALSNNTVNAIFYALIPVFSALLYRLFRGKARRNLAGLAVVVSSLVVALLLEQLWFWLALQGQGGAVPSFGQSVSQYINSHTFAGALREMLFSLLFIVAGFFPASVLLRWYTFAGAVKPGKIRGAKFVKNSVVPIASLQNSSEKVEEEVPQNSGQSTP